MPAMTPMPLGAPPRISLPRAAPPSVRAVGHGLALAAVVAFAALIVWAVGPANLLDALVEAASRKAAVFMGLVGAFIALALAASATALLRGRPGWSIGLAAAPMLVMLVLLVR